MLYEVEQKFRVEDLAAIEARLTSLGAACDAPVSQVDRYFSHPQRDFAQTDEAFRIRVSGGQAHVTYKGPRVDATTKTRRELELPIGGSEGAAAWTELLTALGFGLVADVAKSRRVCRVDCEGESVEVALDTVDEVGTFVELEVVAAEDRLNESRMRLAHLADRLGLSDSVRKSYLELLLERRANS